MKNSNNSNNIEKYESLLKPNLSIEEVPISLVPDSDIDLSESQFQLLDLLHIVILIMTIIILIMVLNIHAAAAAPWNINQYV
ncbi:DEHA2E20328p [Debaryomyces hansenii CBS767]|jgi:hypothetical protein|uniref:DEHA2E20328p n=1 Tax=Debaryomyces hansenii (strain ATCC 36239 / CBS 767 / BCRC 21394 / JCM 1990 / NBRC 0083 / IGC 2968) TaxID=284592 RepID=Q6BNN4_DEBHA|nr:DEHA2E20328p [Debaryomyces hansenii CBS767]CAG88459.1 DEHA2E20328p [Debaryomyces hansenii CBS767]|eukprot:XP_460186.1 DEHA2E20328p [Debaryomyces hansenii CBS767]